MYRIGIDPGITGAIAVLGENPKSRPMEWAAIYDMPVMTFSGKKQCVNAAELTRLLKKWTTMNDNGLTTLTKTTVAFLERVSAMPGQGVTGMFNFGMSYGMIQGVLAALEIPLILVPPSVWKKSAGLIGKEKDYARTLAQQLYPGLELGRKKDIGRADALLIARFGK